MLTFFTIAKKFAGHWKLAQENAIRSWKRFNPDKVILFGRKDEGVVGAARRLGCVRRSIRLHTGFGIPLVSDAFDKAQREATTRIMCYLNADMILMDDFAVAVALVADRFKGHFLMIGQKFDLPIREPLDFSGDWQVPLYKRLKTARFCGRGALDCFVFTRGLYGQGRVPEFLIGRGRWDLWLSGSVIRRKTIPVVDATRAVTLVHSAPPYKQKTRKARRELENNDRLARRVGGTDRALTSFADWELTREMELIKRKEIPKQERYYPHLEEKWGWELVERTLKRKGEVQQ